jgi:hypothetical protein
MKAANESGADIIVLCSSDEEYAYTCSRSIWHEGQRRLTLLWQALPNVWTSLKKTGIETLHQHQVRCACHTETISHSVIGITI